MDMTERLRRVTKTFLWILSVNVRHEGDTMVRFVKSVELEYIQLVIDVSRKVSTMVTSKALSLKIRTEVQEL